MEPSQAQEYGLHRVSSFLDSRGRFGLFNLTFDGLGGGADSVQLFSELFSQPKLNISGVSTMLKNPKNLLFLLFDEWKEGGQNQPPTIKTKGKNTSSKVSLNEKNLNHDFLIYGSDYGKKIIKFW